MWTVLATSILLQCIGEVDAYGVHLFPNPIAEVEEGKTLILHCSCNESNIPDFINWYLNNDMFGLVMDARSCQYQTIPEQYDIDRYRISCHENNFTLSVANISKDKDDKNIWKCDATVIGMDQQLKASTTIVVKLKDAGTTDTKSGQHDKLNTLLIVLVVVAVTCIIAVAFIIRVVGCFLYRKRRNDHVKKKKNKDNDEDPIDAQLRVRILES